MKFELTTEQTGFAQSLDDLLSKADTVAANRAWADGDHEAGAALWTRLAQQGVTDLAAEATPGRGLHRLRGHRPPRRARPVDRVGGLPAAGPARR